jgi:hypothetical protein
LRSIIYSWCKKISLKNGFPEYNQGIFIQFSSEIPEEKGILSKNTIQ